MKKIIGVILIIGGLLFASLAVKALVSAPQSYERIRAAVTMKESLWLFRERLKPPNSFKIP